MTLAAQIVSDVTGVFLNTDDFAESVTHITYLGVATTRTAIFFRDTEQDDTFTNRDDLRESGSAVRDDRGIRIRAQGVIELPTTVTVDDRDTFIIDGTTWNVVRIANGRDSGMQSVMVADNTPINTRKPRIRDK